MNGRICRTFAFANVTPARGHKYGSIGPEVALYVRYLLHVLGHLEALSQLRVSNRFDFRAHCN